MSSKFEPSWMGLFFRTEFPKFACTIHAVSHCASVIEATEQAIRYNIRPAIY